MRIPVHVPLSPPPKIPGGFFFCFLEDNTGTAFLDARLMLHSYISYVTRIMLQVMVVMMGLI